MKLPRAFLVLDQNVLRSHAELARIHDVCVARNVGFLLPDLALYEMSTSHRIRETWSTSLAFLSSCPNDVFIARNIKSLLLEELRVGESLTHDLVDIPGTARFRDILGFFSRNDEAHIDSVVRDMERIVDSVADPTRSQRHKDHVMTVHGHLRGTVPLETRRAIQNDGVAPLAQLLATADMDRTIIGLMNKAVGDAGIALRMTMVDSIAATWFRVVLAYQIWWAARGGVSTLPADKLENDIRDLEYIHAAYLGWLIYSKEKNVNAIFEALEKARDLGKTHPNEIRVRYSAIA